jgi:hypothetical protein
MATDKYKNKVDSQSLRIKGCTSLILFNEINSRKSRKIAKQTTKTAMRWGTG